MRSIKKSVLLKTSLATDIQHSGPYVKATGLDDVKYNDILGMQQILSKDEVVQVVTVGGSSYTPTASTTYKIELSGTFERREGYTGVPKFYSYTTPPVITTIGASAALQREYIHDKLVADINADSKNYVTALSLGTGTGFTLTDDAGYYPGNVNGGSGGRRGATEVIAKPNSDGTGFVSGDISITTAAVYGVGIGSRMIDDVPVIAAYTQNLVSGDLAAPVAADGTYAVSGQKYDIFIISALTTASVVAITGQLAHVVQNFAIFVDNGTGTATTNLTGFKAFKRSFEKIQYSLFANNPNSVIEWFDKPMSFADPLSVAPTGTADVLGWQISPYGSLNRTNIGTQTIIVPVLSANGLLLDQDDTAGDGSHTSANEQTLGVQSFIVGKQEFSVAARVVMGDWTDSHLLVGFRKKATYTADYNDYTDLAAIGSGAAAGDTITTTGILNNAATVATASAASFADAVSAELRVTVDINGLVKAYVNGVSYPIYSAGTTALVLDAGDEFIPFYQHVNIGSGNPAVEISKFVAVSSKDLVL